MNKERSLHISGTFFYNFPYSSQERCKGMFLAFFRNVPYLYRKACRGANSDKPKWGIPLKTCPVLGLPVVFLTSRNTAKEHEHGR
jgi:hypothetical protein